MLALVAMAPAWATEINGAGATFSAPLYERWFQEYNQRHPDVQVNYQAIGSGAGIKQFTYRTVDFGASDAAMDDEQLARVKNNVLLLPMTAGGNRPGLQPAGRVGTQNFRARPTPGIFLGSVKNWDDPAIARRNPGRHAARPADHRRLPLRGQRDHVRFLQTSLHAQPRI